MDCLLHIGNKVDKNLKENLSGLIRDVLDSGFKNHSSDPVIIKALDVVQGSFEVKNVTVTNSVFTGTTGEKK